MSILSDFEDRVGGAVEGMFAGVFRSPVQPAELAKALGKRMDRERSVGVGKVYAPTLYTVLISEADDEKLGAFVDTLSGELATYLVGYAREKGYELPSKPLVRFLVDPKLKLGRFEAYAELASPEELARVAAEMSDALADSHEDEPPTPRAYERQAPAEPPAVDDEPVEPVLSGGATFFDQDQYEPEDLSFEDFDPSTPSTPLPEPEAEAPSASEPPVPVPVVPAATPEPAPPTPDIQPTTVLGAAPSAMSMATVTVTGIEHDVVLRGDRMVAGRLAACDITLTDANASREHAAFVALDGGGWAIEDLGSTNGTWLNGSPVRQRMKLRDGDVVTVGITELVYHAAEG